MAEVATSQIQRHFLIGNVYKRSKRYFDITKLNHIEKKLQLQRRVPQSSKDGIQSRLDQSFICSERLLNDKVHHDLNFFQSKMHQEDYEDNQTTYTATKKLSKTIDMSKMLARSYFQNQKLKYRNQEQFNNFFISQHQPRKSLDFTTFIDRNKSLKTQRDFNPEKQSIKQEKVSKAHFKNVYDKSSLACYVNYQKNGRSKQKQTIDQSPVYNLQKVKRGQNMTKQGHPHIHQFYHGYGKTDPSQLDNRILKLNEYFWRGVREERTRLEDYSIGKKKQDERLGRLHKILNRKKLADQRGQMCDQKYFRRQSNI